MLKMCDRCPEHGCCLDYLGKACSNNRKKNYPEINPTRAELIASMNEKEMARYLVPAILYDLCEDGIPSNDQIERWLASEPSCEEELLFEYRESLK